MFYGKGAGKLPTASAVVGDVVDMARHLNRTIHAGWDSEKLELTDIGNSSKAFFVRTKAAQEKVEEIFGEVQFVSVEELTDECGFITEIMTEAEFDKKAAALGDVISRIRIRNV